MTELGADWLAALLLDAALHDASLVRTLRIAVAARDGADSAATAIDAEIKRLKRGTSLVDYQRVPAFARDLSALCAAIEGLLADADPAIALERMFDFIDLAPRLIERSDDSDGHIGDTIRSAAALLAARAAPMLPAERAALRAYQTYLWIMVSRTGSSRLSRKRWTHRHAQHSAPGSKPSLRACRPLPPRIWQPGT